MVADIEKLDLKEEYQSYLAFCKDKELPPKSFEQWKRIFYV